MISICDVTRCDITSHQHMVQWKKHTFPFKAARSLLLDGSETNGAELGSSLTSVYEDEEWIIYVYFRLICMFSPRCCSERGMNMERGRKKTSVRRRKHYRSKCLLVAFVFYRNCACCISSTASLLFPKFICLLFLLRSFPFSIFMILFFFSFSLQFFLFHPVIEPFSPFIFHFSSLKSFSFLSVPYFISSFY